MDALDASMLSFELQPLDTLRIALENEPAFIESSMPKDDHTLTYVPFIQISSSAPVQLLHRRFLKARGYNASHAKQMVLDCVHWRRTVEDVGIEELYRRIDPYDVRPLGWVAHSDSFHIFRNLPDLGNSSQDAKKCSRAGRWVSTRCATKPAYYIPFSTRALKYDNRPIR